jgi:hypothetical protein
MLDEEYCLTFDESLANAYLTGRKLPDTGVKQILSAECLTR